MAAFTRPGHAQEVPDVPVPPLVTPHFTVDGWTLSGTPLAGKIPHPLIGELTTLLHCVGMRMETPWTYERAAELLDRCGQQDQALAVCEAWFALPASRRPAHAARTRALARLARRLRFSLARHS